MYERLSRQSRAVLQKAHTKSRESGRKCDVLDLLEGILGGPDTAAARLLSACDQVEESLLGHAKGLRERSRLRGKKARGDRAVEQAIELVRERHDRNVSTAHLLVGALGVLESLGAPVLPGLRGRVRDCLPQVADSEPEFGGQAPGPGFSAGHRCWAKTHLSARSYELLEEATKLAIARNGGIIEPEHMSMASENLAPSWQGSRPPDHSASE